MIMSRLRKTSMGIDGLFEGNKGDGGPGIRERWSNDLYRNTCTHSFPHMHTHSH